MGWEQLHLVPGILQSFVKVAANAIPVLLLFDTCTSSVLGCWGK